MTQSLKLATAAAGLLALAACATTPPAPPTAALQAAQLAIANAEQARAAEYAPVELSLARDELASARAEVQRENMILALRLAEQSRAGAELASARTEASKAAAVNAEMRKSTEAMKQEVQRNPGAK
jgi:hypothetical protein